MEGLQKLEEVQRTIKLLNSGGISDPNPYCERFLANFTLLLMQDCGELDIAIKCQMVAAHISKISSLCTKYGSECGEEGCPHSAYDMQVCCDDTPNPDTLRSFCGSGATVGINAMLRSNSTLEDFCRSYFMFHEMEVNQPQSVFRFLSTLSFVESYIYQLDGLNEKLLQLPSYGVPPLHIDYEGDMPHLNSTCGTLGKDPFGPLLTVLEHQGLLTCRIEEELRYGEEYWDLERKLCCALVSNTKISIEEVTRAIHLKSFDYRVLNLLLYKLRGVEVNKLHMEFLSISELLVEVSDDLFDYEDDVVDNNFNILRMFVKYYGASSAPIMLSRFISEAEEKYDKLLKGLDTKLSIKYQKRCEEATKEGGKTYGPSLGTWHIPPVIEDEVQYQKTFAI